VLKGIGREATYYYHPDHLGSVSVVSNHRGEPYERVEYLPFGEIWIEETDPATGYIPFRFTSKELDEETGLYYYGARYYEPTTSRWISPDPAGFELINPMDEDGEPLADGWPEGFGPGQSGGMRQDYSVIEALNWYSYVSNNPVVRIDPEGLNDFVIQIEGEAALGLGPDLAVGLVVDTDNPGESGIIGTVGAAVGITAGIAIGAAWFSGEAEGTGFNFDLNAGPVSFSFYFDEKVNFNGIGVSIGKGLGASWGAVTKSGTLPFIDLTVGVLRAVEAGIQSIPMPPLTPSIPSIF